MSETEVLVQQLIIGLSNGTIIALIALGYTMVYGIVEIINFAHGDLFMLGSFLALTIVGFYEPDQNATFFVQLPLFIILFTIVPIFCGLINWTIDKLAYKALRNAPKLAPLVSAIGVSFILINIGLFWGGLPLEIFNNGISAASPKDFPQLLPSTNILGDSNIYYSIRDLLVILITIPLLIILTIFVKYTTLGKAIRAVAQNSSAAQLMGINTDRIIGITFFIGGALGGVASVVYAFYNNTIYFQMGYRVGMDAFAAAVLGGIGSLPGAFIGGICIGIIRSLSDQYIATNWTNAVVFSVLVLVLVFKPSGILGSPVKDKL
jgi:branched-chain amino acid transport system permease protein